MATWAHGCLQYVVSWFMHMTATERPATAYQRLMEGKCLSCVDHVRPAELPSSQGPEGERLPGDGASCSAPDDQRRISDDGASTHSINPFQEDPVETEGMLRAPRYYRGIYCPSITNSFKNKAVELSYQRYSRRQRQKSLIMVNVVDLALKPKLFHLNYMAQPCSVRQDNSTNFKPRQGAANLEKQMQRQTR
ncbi:unnamed protein product [Spodoptera exigua]|nr:unnamed protein product [Spodoptera exigua]